MAAGKIIAGCPYITGQPETQLTRVGRELWPRALLSKTMIHWAKADLLIDPLFVASKRGVGLGGPTRFAPVNFHSVVGRSMT